MRFLSCKYDLRNLTENRCPECGRPFNPNNPATYFQPASVKRWLIEIAILCPLVYVFLVALLVHSSRPFAYQKFSQVLFDCVWFALVLLPAAILIAFILYHLARSFIRQIVRAKPAQRTKSP